MLIPVDAYSSNLSFEILRKPCVIFYTGKNIFSFSSIAPAASTMFINIFILGALSMLHLDAILYSPRLILNIIINSLWY